MTEHRGTLRIGRGPDPRGVVARSRDEAAGLGVLTLAHLARGGGFELQASCFVTKAVDLEEFLAAVKSIADFRLTKVKLPPRAWG